MKALTLALALLTATTSLAANEPQGAELRRPPPPGRPMPQPAPQPPPRTGTLVVVDRDELNARLARLERLLEEAEERMDGRGGNGRNKVRKAQETLDSVQQLVAEAPPLGAVTPAPRPQPQPPPPPPAPVVRPMPDGPFKRLNEAVARESFAEDKMRIISLAAGDNYFLISQVAELLNHFPFSQDKLTAVRELKPRILDPENGYQLYSAFSFSSDKKRLQDILSQR
ncbi:DUF4476 domain-containing protein [Myxococcus sp. RHSTA-1-4]|uniref:DUF4476 domain-containing protein n=1 Tax=Myxococcus sp. RHSTA-1-4 TaxID=2874601 RepID=UPI001CBB0B06|nr:DUF4476 domain-containing protein [Myxococcus sp. RHSTA-1-4]MBZ4416913.1 DUF4476 domain-containing protein [Myxococcus sp. RHSTA-1-4]